MAKTAHRPSEAHREYVRTKNGDRVRNTAYNGTGKPLVDRSKAAAVAAMGYPAADRSNIIYGNSATVSQAADGSQKIVRATETGVHVKQLDAQGRTSAKFEPAEWSDTGCGYFRDGAQHTTGAANIMMMPGGDALESFWLKGRPVSHDDVVAAAGLNDLEDTAKQTGRLCDENQNNVPLRRAYRSSIISVLSKRGGKNVADTEAASGAIVDRLIATGTSKEDLVGRIADTLRE